MSSGQRSDLLERRRRLCTRQTGDTQRRSLHALQSRLYCRVQGFAHGRISFARQWGAASPGPVDGMVDGQRRPVDGLPQRAVRNGPQFRNFGRGVSPAKQRCQGWPHCVPCLFPFHRLHGVQDPGQYLICRALGRLLVARSERSPCCLLGLRSACHGFGIDRRSNNCWVQPRLSQYLSYSVGRGRQPTVILHFIH